jgi:UDP-2,3-diacylglucosamine hydrolase
MRILFISDLHLKESDAITTARFQAFMREVAPGADALYVMGDLFHVWLGDALIAHDEYAQSAIALFAQLNRASTKIYYIHGNRDFMLDTQFFRASGMELLPEQSTIQLGNQTALLMHGDELCTDDARYQRARKILRSPLFRAFGNRLPFWIRNQIAARLRRASKAHKAGASMQILDANRDAINAAFTRHNVSLMIHGHTHRPTDETINNKRRIVLSDWQQDYGYLEWIDGEFHVRPWPASLPPPLGPAEGAGRSSAAVSTNGRDGR